MTARRFLRGGAATLTLLFGAGQCMVVVAGAAPTATASASQAIPEQVRGEVDWGAGIIARDGVVDETPPGR